VFCPPLAGFLPKEGREAWRAAERDLKEGYALSVECDDHPQRARNKLEAVLGRPTVVVDSGGRWPNPETGELEPKVHLHWRLARPATGEELGLLKEARALATRYVGGDATNITIVHPIRWPGSWHRKAEPKLARITALNADCEIDLTEALTKLRVASPREKAQSQNQKQQNHKDPFGFKTNNYEADLLDIVAALTVIPNDNLEWDKWNRIGMATWRASSSGQAFAAFDAWSQKSTKYDPETTRGRWEHYSGSPPDRIGAGTLFHLAKEACPGWRKPSEQKSQDRTGLPVVQVIAGELPRMADEAEQALLASGEHIFARAGQLVRPVVDTVHAAKGRTTTTVKFRPLCRAAMLDLLSKVAIFQRYDQRSKAWRNTDPPADLCALLLAREGLWRFPRVAGALTTPTLRPDGSVLEQPGFDPATRLFLAPNPDLKMPPLPAAPSLDDARRALQLLSDLLVEFPFKSDIDRAVALSGLLTAVVRGALPTAPMHVFRAHTPGTGKSHLVDTASVIATGRPCPVIAAGKTIEETEKRLGALLRDGVPIVSIDNANGELGGDLLCQLTERPLVRVRILGLSEAPEFECKASVFATGNNLTLVGDMTRRAVLCSLDAGVERPELRKFASDPIARVMENRGAYVAAAITIAKAYRAAGTPTVCDPIGSYGDWSSLVRAPLVWLGQADPVESMATAREEDPELMAIRELFSHWDEHLRPGMSYTTNRIIQLACEKDHLFQFNHPEFRDALLRTAGEGGAVSSRRLGRWLSKISGRIVGGFRLDIRPDPSHGSKFTLRRMQDGQREDADADMPF